MELRFVANLLPAFVVAILFASTRVARRGLNVPVRNRTNPDVTVCGRDRERFDASELALVLDGFPVRIEIGEMPSAQLPRDAGPRVVDVAQPGVPG